MKSDKLKKEKEMKDERKYIRLRIKQWHAISKKSLD